MSAFSQNLEQSLQRALAVANERQYEYATLEHLLVTLIDDEDAGTIMRACNVNLEKLRRDLVACVESELENSVTDGSKVSKPTENFHRVIQRAAIHVGSTERGNVTGADVLVAIFAERESRAVHFLERQGVTRYQVTQYISHGISSNQTSPERKDADDARLGIALDTPPGLMAQVLLLNDDYTPMEFVVHVLERVFDKDRETATRIMLDIHHQGSGSCGIYPRDAAGAKVREVLDVARKHQHPLRCVLK